VDRAIADFEPRPPAAAARRHIPDTVFDGWSCDAFTVRLASVRGYSHRYNGQPRQDHAEVFFHRRGPREDVVFAVADGVSGAEHGELGALTAAESAVNALWQFLEAHEPIDWSDVLEAVLVDMTGVARRRLGVAEPSLAQVSGLMATTLVVGVIAALPDRTQVIMARVGDSGAWILNGSSFLPVFGAKHDPHSVIVSSAVRALPAIPDPVPAASFDLLPHQVLLVGTDGFGDPLGDGTGPVGQLFAGRLATPPPARGLAHLLDFSRETFDDDRTLLAVWPRRQPQQPQQPPNHSRIQSPRSKRHGPRRPQ